MKAFRLFGLVLAVSTLAAAAPLQQPGQQQQQVRNCLSFCMVALCPSPQSCGQYVAPNGQIACGCHS
jgi:hypothetical protein